MAHYDAHGHRNHGFNGYGIKEPADRAAPAAVGYSTTSESYVSSKEQVVKMADYPYSDPAAHDQVWLRRQPYDYDYDNDYEYSYSPQLYHVIVSPNDSPRKNPDRGNSAPHGNYFGMHNSNHNNPHDWPRRNLQANHGNFTSTGDNSSDNDDDVECRDGVCYPKPKNRQDYNKEKKNGNGYGYGGGNDHARTEPHHQTAGPRKYYNTEKLPEAKYVYGNNHTKPVTDAYYDRFAYPGNMVPAPIQTRPDHHGDSRNSPVRTTTQWTPTGGSPRKKHQEVIDSTDAHRPYITTPPNSDHKYKGTIDSETLAKMLGGVFVNDYKR